MDLKTSVFEEMRSEQELCDAVLRVEGTEFKVHKLVLCSCCPFFKSLFTRWSSPDSQVFDIPHVSADTMKTILEFAYTGVVRVTENNILDLFMAADHYSITGINQACCKKIEEKLTPRTCIEAWQFTNTFYYPELRHKAFSYILKNFEEVVARPEQFQHLSVEELLKIIESDNLNVKQESTVFEAVLHWISHNPQERMAYFSKLLSNLRLALINPQYFRDRVCGSELVRTNRDCKPILMRTMTVMLNRRTRGMHSSRSPDPLARPRLPRAVLLAVGGWSNGHVTNIIESYDSHFNRWVDMDNDDGTPCIYHGTVFLNGSLYVIGGFDGEQSFNTTHKYDLVNHSWQEVAPMHSKRCYVSVALLDEVIYAMGGFDGHQRLRTAEKYNPQTNQWTMVASMLEIRCEASSTALNGKIYICGGSQTEHDILFTAEVYSPLRDQWTRIEEMNTPRSGHGVIAYANQIYAVGGFTGEFCVNTVEVYDPESNTWRPAPSMLNIRSNFGIAVFDDRLFIVGGYNGFFPIHLVESFDVKTGDWSEVRDMALPRSALGCSVVFDLPNMADYTVSYFASP